MISLDNKVKVEEEGYYVFEDKVYYDEEEKGLLAIILKDAAFAISLDVANLISHLTQP